MASIADHLNKILSAVYGKDVRQAIHDAIHQCYEDGKVGAVDLVARERIDNLVANDSSSEGNSELIDIRVGYDGTAYETAGEAVRCQNNEKVGYTDIFDYRNVKLIQGALNGDGDFVESNTAYSWEKFIPIKSGVNYICTFRDDLGYKVTFNKANSTTDTTRNNIYVINGVPFQFFNLDEYMTKARLTKEIDDERQVMTDEDIRLSEFRLRMVTDLNNKVSEYNATHIATSYNRQKNYNKGDTVVIRVKNASNCTVKFDTNDSYDAESPTLFPVIENLTEECYVSDPITLNETFRSVRVFNNVDTTIEIFKADSYISDIAGINNYISRLEKSEKMEIVDYGALVQKGMYATGELVDSSTSVSVSNLVVIPGDRYRISINDGFVIVLNYGTGDNIQWYTRMMEVVFKSQNVNITIKRKDNSNISISDDIGLRIEHIIKRNTSGLYDCIVAASDSSDKDKKQADIICDGVNDEIEIECAVNCNVTVGHNARVLLLPGTYNIDNFKECRNGVNEGRGYNAIQVNKSVWDGGEYSVLLEGRYKEYKCYFGDTRLIVTENCYNSLGTEEYAIIGALRNSSGNNLGLNYNMFNIDVKNLFISPYGLQKPIVCVDGAGFTALTAENVHITRYEETGTDFEIYFDRETPIEGLIGIRGVCGSNRGVGNYIKGCRIVGMHEGIALTGEHFVIQDCCEHHCYYGFTLGNYDVRTQNEHPNIFVGNSVEQCYRMALFNRYGATEESETEKAEQTIVYIGGSTENGWIDSEGEFHTMLPIKEIVKGAYRGRIESDYRGADISIFENDGSGKNIIVTTY